MKWCWRLVERASHALRNAALAIAAAGLVLLTVLILTDVLARALANFSILVSFEYSGYLMALVSYFGATYSLKSDGFVRVSALYQKSAGLGRDALDLAIAATGTLYLALISYYAWQFTLRSYELGSRSIAITETPLWIPQLTMCIGASLLGLDLLLETGRILGRIKARLLPL